MVDRFGREVERLALSLQGGGELESTSLAVVMEGVEAYLLSRFRLSAGDGSEVASEAVARFVERCRQGDVDAEKAAGLLTIMARNIAVDLLRRRSRETPSGVVEGALADQGSKDDEIAALLDRRADRAAIVQAMATALRLNDLMTVKVVRIWLDLADEHGRAPGAREVAAVVGVSHSTVLRSLSAFREYVPDDPAQTKTK